MHVLRPQFRIEEQRALAFAAERGFGVIVAADERGPRGSHVPFVDTRSVPSLPRNLSGLGLLLIALYPLQSSLLTPLAAFGRTTYGIYLVHLLFVDPLQLLAKRAHLARHWWLDVPTFLLSVLFSYLLVRLLKLWKTTALLIP